jgi:alpha-glucosidase (family GH31 glycosyl hydrolase)
VLVQNHESSVVDLASDDVDTWSIEVAADRLSLVVFTGSSPSESLDRMLLAVGRQPEPAAPWVFGPWFQAADDEAAELAALAEAGAPTSVIQTYTHYLPCGDHQGRGADERERTDRLHDAGLAVTTYVNPMVCVSFRDLFVPGSLTGAFTTTDQGLPYEYRYFTNRFFDVVQFDFSSPAGVELFHDVLDEVVAAGYDGWMEDFGEYTPDDAVSADGTPGPVMHNRYPDLYHAAGMTYVEDAPRPLVRFNRSGWTGSIRSSQVVWGGDPTTTWGFDGLRSALNSGLGMGLSGVSLWGSDIGGFFTFPSAGGTEQLTAELLARWIEFGAFSPVMRLQAGGVSLVDVERPTVFDREVLPVWRRYTQLRTRLYPYIAGSQDAYAESGLPLMRHLALVTPDDPRALGTRDEHLFGADLLVAPVTEPGAAGRDVYLPDGARWIEWWLSVDMTDAGAIELGRTVRRPGADDVSVDAPVGEIPLFVRSGAVIPLLPADVETLADYGDDDVVRLADRADQRTLLAFPDGDWTGPLGPGETMSADETSNGWALTLDATVARTYTIEASLSGLGIGFVPCAVTADGAAVDFSFDQSTRVLSATVDVAATGTVRITGCS